VTPLRPTRASRAPAVRLLAVAAGACLAACLGYPQRVPGPLLLPEDAPPAQVGEPGGSLVTVHRDSDPVWVRLPGARDDYALPFHAKRERVPTGSLVRTGAGGRAEVLWSPKASLLLFDECRITVGDPLRDEPTIVFHSLTHALLTITPEDRIELPGGAQLRGDPGVPCGPILLEAVGPELMRIVNQAKQSLQVRYREATLDLVPGDSIDLPRLGPAHGGTTPTLAAAAGEPLVQGDGPAVLSTGRLEVRGGGLVALEPARVASRGVAVRLAPGESVAFSGLSQVPPAPPADSSGVPDPSEPQ
jgi:hypothetical protein